VLENGRPVLLPDPVRQLDDLKDPHWVEANLGPYDNWYFPGLFVANPLDRLELVRLGRTAIYRHSREENIDWSPSWAAQMYRPGTEAFEVLVAVMAEFATQVRADGATPVVVILPIKAETVAFRDAGTKTHAALLEALERRGLPTIDLTDAFAEAARRTSPGSLILGHYRPAGNALVARTLANDLPGLIAPTCGRA